MRLYFDETGVCRLHRVRRDEVVWKDGRRSQPLAAPTVAVSSVVSQLLWFPGVSVATLVLAYSTLAVVGSTNEILLIRRCP